MESKLHIRLTAPDRNGRVLHVTSKIAGWKYVGFDLYHLQPTQSISQINVDREICAVIVAGAAALRVNGALLANTQNRVSPFDSKPWALYVPIGANWEVTALTLLEVAGCSAPASRARKAKLNQPHEVILQERKAWTNTSYIYDLPPAKEERSSSLL